MSGLLLQDYLFHYLPKDWGEASQPVLPQIILLENRFSSLWEHPLITMAFSNIISQFFVFISHSIGFWICEVLGYFRKPQKMWQQRNVFAVLEPWPKLMGETRITELYLLISSLPKETRLSWGPLIDAGYDMDGTHNFINLWGGEGTIV